MYVNKVGLACFRVREVIAEFERNLLNGHKKKKKKKVKIYLFNTNPQSINFVTQKTPGFIYQWPYKKYLRELLVLPIATRPMAGKSEACHIVMQFHV